jgi:cytidylate kinase
MIELTILILAIVAIIATRKLWRAWVRSQEADVSIWLETTANERQDRIVEVAKAREALIAKYGKWFTIDDIKST